MSCPPPLYWSILAFEEVFYKKVFFLCGEIFIVVWCVVVWCMVIHLSQNVSRIDEAEITFPLKSPVTNRIL